MSPAPEGKIMKTWPCLASRHTLGILSVIVTAFVVNVSSGASAQPAYAVFLDSYPGGDFYLVELPDLDARNVRAAQPQRMALDLPRRELRRFQIGNGDIHTEGSSRRMVFGGRIGNNGDWDIYVADVNVDKGLLENVSPLIANRRVREEDPRFSWDGRQIVYKCDGKICLYPDASSPVIEQAGCELWAPSLDQSGFVVTYIERCGDAESDRIVRQSLIDRNDTTFVPKGSDGPDRFPVFTVSGEIVYSHNDLATGTADLWLYTHPGYIAPLHSETESDEDPYVYRDNGDYIGFVGWQSDGYDLFVYSRTSRSAVQVTSGTNVLGPILFQ